MLDLCNKLHFEEEKNGEYTWYTMFKIFSAYIC